MLQVKYDDTGLDALVFVAQGDMRQALNSMQSTVAGFGLVSSDNVFKVGFLCDCKRLSTFCAGLR